MELGSACPPGLTPTQPRRTIAAAGGCTGGLAMPHVRLIPFALLTLAGVVVSVACSNSGQSIATPAQPSTNRASVDCGSADAVTESQIGNPSLRGLLAKLRPTVADGPC